ncbi:hypothetical protein L1987_81490 [Smallanthus sonchifolius]|uniref:Uncharacterized protein n=1 Tax=Smallanthus sonchifolius TaxID=185202 RepID=A0ACB8YPX2_9ASTR|nr:hypothetical protein L1987_81490 [Smallanthus sonchifolius]
MEVDDTDQLLAGQFHEVAAAVGGGSDLDFSFQLQMQEAIRASLNSKPSSSSSSDEVFSVYFKGLVSNEMVLSVKMSFVGIGVAICDSSGGCLIQSGKSIVLEAGCRGSEGDLAELEALIEALNAAVNFGLKRVNVFCDSNSVHQFLTGERQPTNKKIVTLVDGLNLTRGKFVYFAPFHMKKNDMKFVYKLARDAIVSETTKWPENDSDVAITEQCTICFGYVQHGQMFSINKCVHRYCFSCMKKHVEAKLLQGKLPECPHDKCTSNIAIESCKKLLNRESYRIMRSRVKEASIPPADKVYCPFSNCSALMSQTEVKEHTPTSSSTAAAAGDSGMRKCVECNRMFCITCKVPWHDNITCSDYMKSFLFKSSNEAKLKSLATEKHWRACIKCKNLVELARGCNHIYCRCGHEFCYKCGAEWINKIPTCKCPIWDERNIVYGQHRRR